MNTKTSSKPRIAAILAGALVVSATGQSREGSPAVKDEHGKSATPAAGATTWSSEDLRRIVDADDLKISPFREDGVTYGTPTWIWCVTVDGSLYVRAYNGVKSRWYQAAVRQKAGRIIAAGKTREVTFEPVTGAINDRIDDAYREKYRGSPYLTPMISERVRAASVRVVPRQTE